jgi:hypothetical protein
MRLIQDDNDDTEDEAESMRGKYISDLQWKKENKKLYRIQTITWQGFLLLL